MHAAVPEISANARSDMSGEPLGTGAPFGAREGAQVRTTLLRRETVKVLAARLKERKGTNTDPLFPSIRETSLSRGALEDTVRRHVPTASRTCPSLARTSCATAMELLHHGIDQTVIAFRLRHENVETMQVYVPADLWLKEKARSLA